MCRQAKRRLNLKPLRAVPLLARGRRVRIGGTTSGSETPIKSQAVAPPWSSPCANDGANRDRDQPTRPQAHGLPTPSAEALRLTEGDRVGLNQDQRQMLIVGKACWATSMGRWR